MQFGRANGKQVLKAAKRALALQALGMAILLTAAEAADCGSQTRVQSQDTLSSIAARCGVSEGQILRLNPGIDGTQDLRSGMVLTLSNQDANESADNAHKSRDVFGQLKSYAEQAGQSVENFAKQAGRSVQDVIKANPDLHQRVLKLGQTLHIPGVDGVQPQISLSSNHGVPGTPVTLSAIGLPAHQRVEIAGGPPGSDYKVLAEAQTSAHGTLQVTLNLPEWASSGKDFIFVIASPEHDVAARSPRFSVVGTTGSAQAEDSSGSAYHLAR